MNFSQILDPSRLSSIDKAMKLTVLGCSTPLPKRNNPCSGYLVSSENTTVLLDCGAGVFPQLVDHIDPRELSAVWISHMHPDHSADLVTLANWALNTDGAPRIRVIGPQGWDRRLNGFISQDITRNRVTEIFAVEYLDDGAVSHIGELTLMSKSVHHSVPSYGARISGKDATFAYSGDTGPCHALEQLADHADIFLCEAGARTPSESHLTLEQAFAVAVTANVGRLLITHTSHKTLPSTLPGRGIPVEIVDAGDEWPVLPR